MRAYQQHHPVLYVLLTASEQITCCSQYVQGLAFIECYSFRKQYGMEEVVRDTQTYPKSQSGKPLKGHGSRHTIQYSSFIRVQMIFYP